MLRKFHTRMGHYRYNQVLKCQKYHYHIELIRTKNVSCEKRVYGKFLV